MEGHDENIDEMKEMGRDATLYVLKSSAKLISPITIDKLRAAWGGISRPWRGKHTGRMCFTTSKSVY